MHTVPPVLSATEILLLLVGLATKVNPLPKFPLAMLPDTLPMPVEQVMPEGVFVGTSEKLVPGMTLYSIPHCTRTEFRHVEGDTVDTSKVIVKVSASTGGEGSGT